VPKENHHLGIDVHISYFEVSFLLIKLDLIWLPTMVVSYSAVGMAAWAKQNLLR
jgi:hypothetical protein